MPFNEQLADRAAAFIRSLKHTKGTWHGKNFDLLPWQEKIVRDIFGTIKESGYTSLKFSMDEYMSSIEFEIHYNEK